VSQPIWRGDPQRHPRRLAGGQGPRTGDDAAARTEAPRLFNYLKASLDELVSAVEQPQPAA
jgi:hypothetical protein